MVEILKIFLNRESSSWDKRFFKIKWNVNNNNETAIRNNTGLLHFIAVLKPIFCNSGLTNSRRPARATIIKGNKIPDYYEAIKMFMVRISFWESYRSVTLGLTTSALSRCLCQNLGPGLRLIIGLKQKLRIWLTRLLGLNWYWQKYFNQNFKNVVKLVRVHGFLPSMFGVESIVAPVKTWPRKACSDILR